MSLQNYAASLSRQHNISAAFCERYLSDRFGKRQVSGSLEDFIATLSATELLYLNYTLSTNQRGRETLARFPVNSRPRRVLDIGCGYGGTVKAFAEAGDDAFGLEIDPDLAEYARLNLGDTSGATVRCLDIVTCDPQELGQFDLILCSDVIEHVGNPDIVLDTVAKLLRPGGTFVMHVPNKDSIHQVLSDGHFCIFGITLLSRQEGRELKRQMQGWDDPYHHMGQHLPLDYYLGRLRASALSTRLDEASRPSADGALGKFGEACAQLEIMLRDDRLSWFTRRELTDAFARYASEFMPAYARAISCGDESEFARRFVTPTWTILAQRSI